MKCWLGFGHSSVAPRRNRLRRADLKSTATIGASLREAFAPLPSHVQKLICARGFGFTPRPIALEGDELPPWPMW